MRYRKEILFTLISRNYNFAFIIIFFLNIKSHRLATPYHGTNDWSVYVKRMENNERH